MFKFEKEQNVYDIAGVKVGGQPGENPTVLVGSIFYAKQRIVKDSMKGDFDKKQAEALIKKQEELSEKTGNPTILDVVGDTPEALTKYIDFVSDITDAPFLVDGPSSVVRIPVMKHVMDVGLGDRAIYNSIEYHWKKEEIDEIKRLGVESSIVMGFNPRDPFPKGKIELFAGNAEQKGLLDVAFEAGLKKVILDTAVLDVTSIGFSARAIYMVKEKFGQPAGCGPANGISLWKKLREEHGKYVYSASSAAAALLTIVMGADFVLYGKIEEAETVFPICAMADAITAYNARTYGIRTKTRNHPLYKIF